MTTAPTIPAGPTAGRRVAAWLMNLVLLVVGGSVSLFVAFLFAYGFSEGALQPGQHQAFLLMAAGSALVGGLILGAIDAPVLGVRFRDGLAFGLLTSFAAHLLAVGGGVIVSLANEEQNSVTADQADAPFVVTAVACFVLAIVAIVGAVRVTRPTRVDA